MEAARCWWLIPVILGTSGGKIRRIVVQGLPRQIVHETQSPNQTRMDWRCDSSSTVPAFKGKALSSLSSPTKNINKKRIMERRTKLNTN
jgi:hypothetical protein